MFKLWLFKDVTFCPPHLEVLLGHFMSQNTSQKTNHVLLKVSPSLLSERRKGSSVNISK